jgi:hypothetical protein
VDDLTLYPFQARSVAAVVKRIVSLRPSTAWKRMAPRPATAIQRPSGDQAAAVDDRDALDAVVVRRSDERPTVVGGEHGQSSLEWGRKSELRGRGKVPARSPVDLDRPAVDRERDRSVVSERHGINASMRPK